MLQVHIDTGKCEGFGNCVMADPDSFDIGDDGKVIALRTTAGEGERAVLEEAARSCPVEAIRISGR